MTKWYLKYHRLHVNPDRAKLRPAERRPDEVRSVELHFVIFLHPPTTYDIALAINMSRPVSRKKSCAPCRISKARCSLESPCRRCEERNLDCKYDHIPRRSAAYRALRPLPAVGEDIPEDLEQPSPHVGRLAHNGSTSAGSSMEDQLDHFSGTPMNWDALLSPSFLHFSLGCELDLPNLPSPSSAMRLNTLQGSQALPEPSGLPWLRNGQQPDVPDDQRALLSLGGSDSLPSARASHLHAQRKECQPRPPHPFYQDRPLTPRRNKGVASCFTVKVLLGQLLAYPKMMAKGGRLPPFIFPPCGVEGQNLPADSCGKEFHKCLPETLAICCNLVQSFETRTTGSASFVWKSIYKEVERLQQEYTSYDCEGLLQALQAILIYLLLQAGDPDSIPDNDVTTLLSAPDSIARALHVSCNYTINLTSSTKIDRREWVIRESVRR
ncbi:C6 finger domain-containing protein [Colletotrichum tofieldiae]|uniref:C6 finger domain-containing protein n=1 Tax=Colletotrichum tofieldiae TaxID=708197 RepID=A0A166VLM3_9PEZI|nr:C6 finger domain-containing protein [Colletotrichum tofieldiae]